MSMQYCFCIVRWSNRSTNQRGNACVRFNVTRYWSECA